MSHAIATLGPQREFTMSVVENPSPASVYVGDMGIIGALGNQKRPHHAKNPFLARITAKKELFASKDRSCLHLELDIGNSGLRYAAGDHVAIYPTNNEKLVQRLAKRLGVDLEQVVLFAAVDPFAKKKTPFPSPCAFGTALRHYVDIASHPHTHVLRELIHYTSDAPTIARLQHLTSRAGAKDYLQCVAWLRNWLGIE
jgi:NADPH-ferrihemoprotein reductase